MRMWPRSRLPRALISSSILLWLPLLSAGCASTRPNVMIQAALPCSSLIPDDWKTGVKGAPIPKGLAVGDWIGHDDAQTAKLDEANQRRKDTMAIIAACEAREAQAAQALQPKPWWKLW